jgi:hypothetical protein
VLKRLNLFQRRINMNTFVGTKRVIKTVINGNGPDFTLISVIPPTDPESSLYSVGVELVIGAWRQDACAHRFTKKGLAELIEILQDIHDALEDGEST